MKTRRLFTEGNPKTRKGESYGYLTAILHLAPAHISGTNMCASSTPQCREFCLNKAGRGIFDDIQQARIKRTLEYVKNPAAYVEELARNLVVLARRAAREGLTLVCRPNGTSDQPYIAAALAERFPDLQLYDYTKLPYPERRVRPNYHLTFSRSENNEADCHRALWNRINVAVVFDVRKGQPLPADWQGWPVIDGDEHDLRFLDPQGVVVGLRAKGPARKQHSGFVVSVTQEARVAA